MNTRSVGEAIRKGSMKIVPSRDHGPKKYACKFCGKLVVKLVPHLLRVHKNEDEIQKISSIQKISRKKGQQITETQKKRLELISEIRKAGNFKHNLKANMDDDFIPSRRPRMNKGVRTVDAFAICPKCKDAYIKKTLHKHVARCTNKSSKHNHSVQTMAKRALGNYHDMASEHFISVACHLRDDLSGMVARHDLAIVLFINLECFKYRHSKHHGKMIRAKLRRLGRLLIQMRKIDNNITDFASVLDPSNFDTFIKAVNAIAVYDEERQLFERPATADALGMLTKEVCAQWIIECAKMKNEQEKKNAELFLFIYEKQFSKYIGSTVSESQAEMRRLKKIKLPSQEDIKTLHDYLQTESRLAYDTLKKDDFNYSSWKKLLEATLISVQLFNRRRAGEIERLKLVHFEAIENINEETCPDIYTTLNEEAKIFVNRYSRILLRGKRNRTVPVLLDGEMRDCVKLILKYRKNAKVSSQNPYVFALPGNFRTDCRHASACELMRTFSKSCGAQVPESLRGTLLRKHIATTCISLNLRDHEVEDLANFMGHADKIHRSHYRMPLAQRDIVHVASLLEKAQGVFSGTRPVNETDSEEESDQLQEPIQRKSTYADDGMYI